MTTYGKTLNMLRRKQPLDALAELVRAAKGTCGCNLGMSLNVLQLIF